MSHEPGHAYQADRTALLFIDPYNDFLHENGKLWPMVAEVARGVNLHEKLRSVLEASRAAGLPIFIVPHHQWDHGDFEHWDHPTPYQLGAAKAQVFERGSWGAEWFAGFEPKPGDTIVKEHWGSSGFANTDLDLLLKQKRVSHVILIGLIANTCLESTGRFASELGYHVTLVRDATAAASKEAVRSAHDVNGPTYAHAILTAAELIASLPGQPSLS